MSSPSFSKGSFAVIAASLLAAVIGYFFNPLLVAPRLGPEGLAVLGSFLYLNFAFSLPQRPLVMTLTHFLAAANARGDRTAIAALISSSLKKITLFGIGLAVLTLLFTPWITEYLNLASATPVVAAVVMGFAGLVLAAVQGILQGLMRFNGFALTLIVDPLLRLAIGAVLLGAGMHADGAMGGYLAGYTAASVFGIWFFRDCFKHTSAEEKKGIDFRTMYRYSAPIWAYSAYLAFAFSVDGLLAKHFFPDGEAGLYVAVSTLAKLTFIVVLPMSFVTFAVFSNEVSENKSTLGTLTKSLAYTVAVCIAAILGSALLPHPVIRLTYGADFLEAAPFLVPASISFTPLAINIILVSYYLALKRKRFVLGLLIGMIIHFSLMQMFHDSLASLIWAQTAGGFAELILTFAFGQNIFKK